MKTVERPGSHKQAILVSVALQDAGYSYGLDYVWETDSVKRVYRVHCINENVATYIELIQQ